MRLNYTDEEDYPGQFNIWQANCNRSLQGKRGQAALKRLEVALLSMPTKRLIREAISEVNEDAGRLEVCALGAVAMMEGHEKILYSDEEPEEAGKAMGFPRLVAWKVVEMNDIQFDGEYRWVEGPTKPQYEWERARYRAEGIHQWFDYTPEERYEKVLTWVRSQLRSEVTTDAVVSR